MAKDTKENVKLKGRAAYFTATKLEKVPEDEAKRMLVKARKKRPDLFKDYYY